MKARRFTILIALIVVALVCATSMFLRADNISSPTYALPDDETDSVAASHEKMPGPRVKKSAPSSPEEINTREAIDLNTPSNLNTTIEYDPRTGQYVVRTKAGEFETVTPFSLTPDEYYSLSLKKEMNDYWMQKNADAVKNYEDKFNITDMKFSLGPAEKLFGPGGVQIKTQGSAELIFAIKHNNILNYSLAERLRKTTTFDFDEKIQLSVNATVGEKIGFNLNYNTEATFNFDQQMLKLSYNGNEDEIVKSIDVGNVTLPLNSTLIKGNSALFGFKTELQFGKLNIVAVASQQQSETQHVNSQGGSQLLDFEVDITNYDENRHFFLSQFFRDTYDGNMTKLPYITSGINITRCEVWVTNKRANFEQSRNIVAFMDLGESEKIDNPHWTQGYVLHPDNAANSLYDEVKIIPGVRDVQQCNSVLDGIYNAIGIRGGEDYEKIESARRLDASEYTLNSTLGYISLRTALNQDEVLGVAFEYTYNGKTYQVGEFSTDGIDAPNALIVKLLKGTATSPETRLWDLMMKNIYYLGGNQVQHEKFKLNIQYRNDSSGVYVNYINEGPIANQLLLRVLGLDRLDSRNEQSPDGKFDYVENYTIYSSNGRLIFPVVEPFGEHLAKQLGGRNTPLAQKYCYFELYDSTKTAAEVYAEKNKFRIAGEFQASSGSVIQLGAMNVPRGSVVVTAGGQTLTENVDYTVDYIMGTVTILNQSLLASGTNIDVQLENQSTFNMQRKTLLGAHAEYAFSKDFSIGATIMHLSEMPLVTKTAMGEEPIANTLWGFNAAYRTDAQWLTQVLNAIPGLNATAPSSISVNAEFAQMIPGHRHVDNNPGYAYMDDFENAETTIDLSYPFYWKLSSTPYEATSNSLFPEASLSNNYEYGKNRSLIAWFTVDNTVFNRDNSQTPSHLRANKDMLSNHLTREIKEQELFPNRDALLGQSSYLTALNISFYPNERGPYNLDRNMNPATGLLNNPRSRWGGIMRKIDNSNFESANIEYLEFWLMDPFVYDTLNTHTGGDLYINLGDVSEDILRDGKKFFENGMPSNGDTTQTDRTVWGRVPRMQSTVLAFDSDLGSRDYQDVGLDGLRTDDEYLFTTYKDYVADLRASLNPAVLSSMETDPFSPLNDPAGDNYHHYRGSDYDNAECDILTRYKRYNGTEGNSPAQDRTADNFSTTATTVPDAEDINQDNTLNEYEKYYQYRVSIHKDDMQVGRNYIVNKITTQVTLANGQSSSVNWYQFKVPLREFEKNVGGIRGFTSIRFIRLFLTDFEQTIHLRFGTLELVRGEWKTYTKDLFPTSNPPATTATIDVSSVNIEENNDKEPVNYVLPPGVTRQTDPSQTQLTQQNEQALLLKVMNISPYDARAVYKNIVYDMRMYKRMQMFVHAEAIIDDETDLADYETTVFMRFGSDFTNNYYEYEIPLKLTPAGHYTTAQRSEVWPEENMFDFAFSALTNAKKNRNIRIAQTGGLMSTPYSEYDPEHKQNKITIKGNPSLGEVKSIMIGVRNQSGATKNVEVWVNELRLTDYDESGGWAALANVAINLSDAGSIAVSGRYETAGFGGIEESLQQRRLDNYGQVDFSARFDFGRFFPEKAGVNIPVYYSYGYNNSRPKYNPLDEDILLTEAIESLQTKHERDSLRRITTTKNINESFNITNMKVNIKSKKPKLYDPANFSVSFAYINTQALDPETDRNFNKSYSANFAYSFTTTPNTWEPFKNNKKLKDWKILKDFGLNYEPNNLSFVVNLNRNYSETQLRDLTGAMEVNPYDATNSLLSFSKDFTWSREFDLKYDLTKNLKFTLHTLTNSRFDETKHSPINRKFFPEEYELWRDTIRQSIASAGRPIDYQQLFTASWEVPINKIPYLEFITARAQYSATYNWQTGVTYDGTNSMGNTISNLTQWQADGQMNFETLYNKSKYLKKVNQQFGGKNNKGKRKSFVERTYSEKISINDSSTTIIAHHLTADKISVAFEDRSGKPLKLRYKVKDRNNIEIISRKNIDSVKVTIKTLDPNELTGPELAKDVTVRLLMLVRKIQVTYMQSSALVMPGFDHGGRFFGQSVSDKIIAPGLDFSFGVPSRAFLDDALTRGWMVINDSIVNPATYTQNTDFDGKLMLEPFPGFKIEFNSKRAHSEQQSIQYMFEGTPTTLSGTFRSSYCILASAFWSIGKASNNYESRAFNDMLANRDIIAGRLEERYRNTTYPTTGFAADNALAGRPYSKENGGYNINSADVLIPAFLAAYTGHDPHTQSTDIFTSYLAMIPSWKITFDGLSKIKAIEKYFKSISITHSYQCLYNIGSYSSFSNYVQNSDGLGFVRDVTTGNPIPSSPYDVASVSITESLSPLIGVDMALKNSIIAKIEYRRQRVLTLNISANQLLEATNNEWVVGVGYVLKDFDMILKLKQNKTKKVKNNLTLRMDFSFKDISTLLRKMDSVDDTQATAGNKTIALKFTADYVFSSKLNLRLFVDYQNNKPYISTSYPIANTEVGLSVKFMLTR